MNEPTEVEFTPALWDLYQALSVRGYEAFIGTASSVTGVTKQRFYLVKDNTVVLSAIFYDLDEEISFRSEKSRTSWIDLITGYFESNRPDKPQFEI